MIPVINGTEMSLTRSIARGPVPSRPAQGPTMLRDRSLTHLERVRCAGAGTTGAAARLPGHGRRGGPALRGLRPRGLLLAGAARDARGDRAVPPPAGPPDLGTAVAASDPRGPAVPRPGPLHPGPEAATPGAAPQARARADRP